MNDDLRRGAGKVLDRRRRTARLSLIAPGAMGAVAAYQNGVIGRLPEPPLPIFDADKVDASAEAYEVLRTPDASLGLLSYAATLALAGMGSKNRFRDTPVVPIALGTGPGRAAGAEHLHAARFRLQRRARSKQLRSGS